MADGVRFRSFRGSILDRLYAQSRLFDGDWLGRRGEGWGRALAEPALAQIFSTAGSCAASLEAQFLAAKFWLLLLLAARRGR